MKLIKSVLICCVILNSMNAFAFFVNMWTVENNKPQYFCTGLVVAPDTILTHDCTLGKDENHPVLLISETSMAGFNGSLDQALSLISSSAKKGFRHEGGNLMIFFLRSPLNVKPALLPSTFEPFEGFRDFVNDTMIRECEMNERVWCQVKGLPTPE